jgi:hypothetical protein
MRGLSVGRRVFAVAVIVALSLSMSAAPREQREPVRGKRDPIVKIIKKMIRSLGDGLVLPIP